MASVPFDRLGETEIRKPKSKLRWVVLIAFILIVVAVIFVCVYLIGKGNSKESKSINQITSEGTFKQFWWRTIKSAEIIDEK